MTNKDIQRLIDKYLEGETTLAEERQLALALQQNDTPKEWQAIRLMLSELTLGEAEYDDIMMQRQQKPSAFIIALRTIMSATAIYLVGLFVWLQRESTNPVPVQADFTNQRNPRAAGIVPCTDGTPMELYMCYMEQKRKQPKTFTEIKHWIYGNKK